MSCWLLALSFILGVVLTLAFTLRRVQREVPVYEVLGKGPVVQDGGEPAAGDSGDSQPEK